MRPWLSGWGLGLEQAVGKNSKVLRIKAGVQGVKSVNSDFSQDCRSSVPGGPHYPAHGLLYSLDVLEKVG